MEKTRKLPVWSNKLAAWIIPVVVVILWAIWGTTQSSSNSLLPTIEQVWKGFLRLLKDGTLWENIKISTFRAFKGLFWGGAIGFTLGVINGISRKIDHLLNNPIQMVRNVPYLAMMPLILVWFGIGETTKTILIAIGTFFPIYLNTYSGIRYIDSGLIEMSKVYGIKNKDLYLHVIFPGALPSIMIGLKQSLGRMWVILIVAEQVAAKSGIGYMVTNAREFMLMDIIVLGLILYAILGSLSDIVTTFLERKLLKWRYSTERRS
ncbi:MAG: ABC transporter permease subunit [Lachnospiraceae bacterium]|nr:ABC transporter permease subunit [Lachnospiraceae bacterium]